MSNADTALKAARDLNADSLVPEIFRAANEAFYKAKRDFRLKDFDNSRKHALQATRLAEQAEFEAYRLGGATPEASSRSNSPEGSYPDPDAAFREGSAPPEPDTDITGPSTPPPPEPEEKGVDYNEYMRQKEAAEAQKKEEKKKEDKEDKDDSQKPSGPLGPQGPTGNDGPMPPVGVPVTGLNQPQSGFLGPATGNERAANFKPTNLNQDLRPRPGSPKPQIYYEGAEPVSTTIRTLEPKPISEVTARALPELGNAPPPEKMGFDDLQTAPIPTLETSPIPKTVQDEESQQQ